EATFRMANAGRLAEMVAHGETPMTPLDDERPEESVARDVDELRSAAKELLAREPLIVGRGPAEDARLLASRGPKARPAAVSSSAATEEGAEPAPTEQEPAARFEVPSLAAVSVRFRMGPAYETDGESGTGELLLRAIGAAAGGKDAEGLDREFQESGCVVDER